MTSTHTSSTTLCIQGALLNIIVSLFAKSCAKMGGPRFTRIYREQTAAMESGSTQEIFIPWDSEGLATPLQQTKRNGRLREGFASCDAASSPGGDRLFRKIRCSKVSFEREEWRSDSNSSGTVTSEFQTIKIEELIFWSSGAKKITFSEPRLRRHSRLSRAELG